MWLSLENSVCNSKGCFRYCLTWVFRREREKPMEVTLRPSTRQRRHKLLECGKRGEYGAPLAHARPTPYSLGILGSMKDRPTARSTHWVPSFWYMGITERSVTVVSLARQLESGRVVGEVKLHFIFESTRLTTDEKNIRKITAITLKTHKVEKAGYFVGARFDNSRTGSLNCFVRYNRRNQLRNYWCTYYHYYLSRPGFTFGFGLIASLCRYVRVNKRPIIL